MIENEESKLPTEAKLAGEKAGAEAGAGAKAEVEKRRLELEAEKRNLLLIVCAGVVLLALVVIGGPAVYLSARKTGQRLGRRRRGLPFRAPGPQRPRLPGPQPRLPPRSRPGSMTGGGFTVGPAGPVGPVGPVGLGKLYVRAIPPARRGGGAFFPKKNSRWAPGVEMKRFRLTGT